jgi:hypothetical protein
MFFWIYEFIDNYQQIGLGFIDYVLKVRTGLMHKANLMDLLAFASKKTDTQHTPKAACNGLDVRLA